MGEINMKVNRRRVIVGVVALIVVVLAARFVVPTVMLLVVFFVSWVRLFRRAEQGRKHLFFETNYEELLAACRALSRRTVTKGSESRSYFDVTGYEPDPEAQSLPQVILDLKPSRVFTNYRGGGEVYVELMPGPEWFGVIAFPEGHEGRESVRLIEGLWYDDSEYHYADYKVSIDNLVARGRHRRARRAAARAQTPQQE
jgi:hypothetical protein